MSILSAELKTRVITALVLVAVVIGILATGSSRLWSLLVTVVCLAAAWEFLRLVPNLSAAENSFSWLCILFGLGALTFAVFENNPATGQSSVAVGFVTLLAMASAFWLLVVPRQLRAHRIGLGSWWARLTIPLLICSAWLSAVLLQRSSTGVLIAVVVITVVADISAYFVGRAFGRVKLAPSISPGKTREGALGGVVAAALWTAGMAVYLGIATDGLSAVLAAAAGAFLGAFAVLGDLWESLLKRLAGVKDSSNLLPGHGGVLDRIDAQLAVLPLATLLLTLVKPLW